MVTLLEAMAAWQRDPSPRRRHWLRRALWALLEAAGAAGAYLELDAPPLTPFALGVGTLSRHLAGSSRTGPAEEAAQEAPAPRRRRTVPQPAVFQLFADGGRLPLGTLWLDAPSDRAALAVRVLEIALDAAWAREAVRRSVERLEALDAASRAIAGVLDLDQVLQLIVDRVRELVGARYAALGIISGAGTIERFITSGISAEERERIGAPPRGRGLLGKIIRENRPIRIRDITTHPEAYGFPPHHPVMHSLLGVPVDVGGRPVGRLYLTDKIGAPEFSEDDERLAVMFAAHAAIAIENARLHERVQQLAVVEERERIGQDLHDGVIQSLYAVGLSLEDVPELMRDDPAEARERVERAIDSLNLTIRDIRNFIFGLRPELLGPADLGGSLAALADEFRLNTLIDLDLVADEEALADLPPEHRVQLLQIAREALSNVARHAKATAVQLVVERDGPDLVLSVVDNGRGFNPDASRPGGHQGLQNMRARAASLGGQLVVDSRPGRGTRIIARVPLMSTQKEGDVR